MLLFFWFVSFLSGSRCLGELVDSLFLVQMRGWNVQMRFHILSALRHEMVLLEEIPVLPENCRFSLLPLVGTGIQKEARNGPTRFLSGEPSGPHAQ